ncbi:type II restriction endonuclease subunit M [Pseudomonas sp. PA1(2017)]|uniref:DNA cytosine methyltransferase n=1 Tax=Pseudomonas sp. PA1(2017) TaxID=1932113 RepID=UPI000960147F|nr:DNA cytosine methyltransferase [Pseudomonas sp. PA1(2017)]OLU15361.1 type II restriction endonuclease subunit M [Pseudomonas sp. PA1(2017)]
MTSTFRIHPQPSFNFGGLVIDNFAGGGGASTGIEMALGRPVDIAINHDPEAIAMHEINHPHTKHYCESVWEVDPREITGGRPVDLAWFSPDCKHFSKAKGGKPVKKEIRGLAWVAIRYAATVRPRVIMLENVEEFVTWGPLAEGRPCPKNKGRTFKSFVNALRRHGYQVEWRELRANQFGAATIRKRLFLIARCDGMPIVWPEPTHLAATSIEVKAKQAAPQRLAADIIDWSLPCPSIFERKRPLAEATLRRIARGIQRYVIDSDKPFLVKVNHGYDYFRGQPLDEPLQTITSKLGTGVVVPTLAPFITEHANGSSQRNMSVEDPLRTICAQVKGGHFAVVAPTLVQLGYGEREGQAPRALDLQKPLGTVVASGKHGLVAAFLAKHYGGNYTGPGAALGEPAPTVTTVDHNALVLAHIQRDFGGSIGHAAAEPLATITAGGGGKSALVASSLIKLRGTSRDGQPTSEPLHTVTASGNHLGEVRAFLLKYYDTAVGQTLAEPLHTITTKDRIGLVMVKGEPYQIVDIGMRMLEPHELYAAQGFPANYIHTRTATGKRLSKASQVRMCGNSVCPPVAAALVRANLVDQQQSEVAA